MAASVSYVRAAVVTGVGVEDFFVEASAGDAHDVAFADDGSGIDDDHDKVIFGLTFAQEREDAIVAVVAINPFEALPVEIYFVKSGFAREKVIEVGD